MPLNDPDAPGPVLRPLIRVVANGSPVETALEIGATHSNTFHAGTFTAQLAPAAFGDGSAGWWTQQTDVEVDLQWGERPQLGGGVAWQSLMVGRVDRIGWNPDDFTITLTGRDLTGKLIDNRAAEIKLNQTASAIVSEVAARNGLAADVTATTEMVSRYYQNDHTLMRLSKHQKMPHDWDVVVALAKLEGMDAWVDGRTLYWNPPPAPDSDAYVIRRVLDAKGRQVGNSVSLSCERVLTLAKDIKVSVRSYHQKTGKRASVEATQSVGQTVTAGGGGKNVTEYVYVRPGLTPAQAQKFADRMLAEISRHEVTMNATLWPDMILTPHVLVRVQGTGSDFDQAYYPDKVERHISVSQGFTMSVSGKNRSPSADQSGGGE